MTRVRVGSFQHDGHDYCYVAVPEASALSLSQLSSAERDVALQVYRGSSPKQIANTRGVSVSTINNQLASIFSKLGVVSRSGLVAYLARQR